MFNIIQVGTGGTGGHVTHFLAPYIKTRQDTSYLLVDGDVVEEKNIARQNFTCTDVGKYKSQVIGERYNVSYITEFINEEMLINCLDTIQYNVILGCVDRVDVRLMIDRVLKLKKKTHHSVYIDGGNTNKNAQVVIYDYSIQKGIDITSYFEGVQDEDLKTASCSEMGDQTIQANMLSATYICNNAIYYLENKLRKKKKVFKNYKFIITPKIVSIS